MGGWRKGSDSEQEVFRAKEYRHHVRPGNYTRSVIAGSGYPATAFVDGASGAIRSSCRASDRRTWKRSHLS